MPDNADKYPLLIQDEYEKIVKDFKSDLAINDVENLEFFKDSFNDYKKKVKNIQNEDSSNNTKLFNIIVQLPHY